METKQPEATSCSLESLKLRLDVVEKKTVDGAQSVKTIMTNLRELASAEEKHGKTHQKIHDMLQYVPHTNENVLTGLKNWHAAMLKNSNELTYVKRQFAASLVSHVVNPLQEHLDQYRRDTRKIFYDLRASYESLVNKQHQVATFKEKYYKACRVAENAIRHRNATKEKLENENRKTDANSSAPVDIPVDPRKLEALEALNRKVKACLDESDNAKEAYVASDAECVSECIKHNEFVVSTLRKLEEIEIQREDHLQNQVFFRLASMYQDTFSSTANLYKTHLTTSEGILKSALDQIAQFSEGSLTLDASLGFVTEQMANDTDTLAKLCDVFSQMKMTFEAHAKRLQQLTANFSWTMSSMEGPLLVKAWEKISTAIQVLAHIHDEYSITLSGFVTSQWKDLKAHQMASKRQILSRVQDIHLKRQGVENNERDACQRYNQAKKELQSKQSQIEAVEREVVEEAKSPEKDKGGVSLVSLGWKDPAKIRLVKLKRQHQEFEETDMATATKQYSFARSASGNFHSTYNSLVTAVHTEFIKAQSHSISSLVKILTAWQSAVSKAESCQLQILHDVFESIEAIRPKQDVQMVVATQLAAMPMAVTEPSHAPVEFFKSELIENELKPPPPPVADHSDEKLDAKTATLLPAHQIEFGFVCLCLLGILVVHLVHQKLRGELLQVEAMLGEQQASVDYLDMMLQQFD
ncbi:unnamed protein product [Aphanomyces euteiches]